MRVNEVRLRYKRVHEVNSGTRGTAWSTWGDEGERGKRRVNQSAVPFVQKKLLKIPFKW